MASLMPTRLACVSLAFVSALGLPAALSAQAHREEISGRVTGDSGKAIADAQIIATRAPDRAGFRATTEPVQLAILPGQAAYLFKAKSVKGSRTFYFGPP